MPGPDPFVTFVEDLLSPLGPVRARAMFGGHGLYLGDVMFGLLDGDELFLKTDDRCRQAFVDAGCRRWSYQGRGRRIETGYYRPPDEAHDDPEAMLPWARLALEAARRAKAEQASRRKPRPSRTSAAPRAGTAPAGRSPRRRRRHP